MVGFPIRDKIYIDIELYTSKLVMQNQHVNTWSNHMGDNLRTNHPAVWLMNQPVDLPHKMSGNREQWSICWEKSEIICIIFIMSNFLFRQVRESTIL